MEESGATGLAITGFAIPGFEGIRVLHESKSRIVYLAVRLADCQQVVLKTLADPYPQQRSVDEVRREYEITSNLNIDGVICVHSLVSYGSGNLAIEMEPFGKSLADLIAEREGVPLPLERFFSIAIGLAEILGQVHDQELVHKDIKPDNVLVEHSSNELRLIDFSIASQLSRERQSVTLSKRMEGSLPYISPEQTGRMNRDLDYRTDYYSLGVTLFELLTGQLPFKADRALEWVHRHISQLPPEAHQLNSNVPLPLAKIISKLMAKNAEDRYQSTRALNIDLKRCRDEYARSSTVVAFELARHDVPRRFQIPQELYGRELPLEQMAALFDDVAHGALALCLVSGHSGVGKSAVVNELAKSIIRQKGNLIRGKFDQFQHSSAYSAIATAFASLMQQVLGEDQQRLHHYEQALAEALRPNAQLIIDLVPELELIIGAQPAVAELTQTEAQNRLHIVFENFVKVFADEQHPLVIFLDDLQWSDVPTLNLIRHLTTARDLNHLLLVGAYRVNEVDASHPLRVLIEQSYKTKRLTEITLQPLGRAAVNHLTADTLHSDPKLCEALSDLLYEKAQGNPFFIKELFTSLSEDGTISFNAQAGCWVWDIEAIQRADVGDNVVDFMVASLRRLQPSTQRVLRLAACIGNSFTLRTLSMICEQSMVQTSADLHEALKRNIVVPLNDSYKFVNAYAQHGADGRIASQSEQPGYKFQHDRVHQAAYTLIDDTRKPAVHLSIGRLMQAHCNGDVPDAQLIDVVSHYNAGRNLLETSAQRRELAQMNLKAGIFARRSSAYKSALGFLMLGNEMLPDNAWQTEHELTLALAVEIQHCAYLTGDFDEADAWTETLLERAQTAFLRAGILSARTRQYATVGKMPESIRAAIAGLSLLGIELSEKPTADDIKAEIAAVEVNLNGRAIPNLIDAPELTDPEAQAAIRLLMEIFPAAFLSGSGNLFPYLVLKSVNLSLRHGNSPESAFAYAAYGMLLCGTLNNPALGFEYGKLAVAMNERLNDIALKSRIIYVYTMFIHHWSNSWSSMTSWFIKGIEAGYQSGDLLYLAYSAQDCVIWDPTLDLQTATREQRKYLDIVKSCEYQDSLDSGTLFLQLQLNFQGLTDDQYSLSDASFDELQCVQGMRQRKFMTGIANYHIYKAEIHFLYGDYSGAYENVKIQDQLVASSMSLPQLVRFTLVAFLTRAALYPSLERSLQQERQKRLRGYLKQMADWAENCPQNFEHLRLIMCAELARLDGNLAMAMSYYEEAITAAESNGFRRDQALANELAANHLMSLGLSKAASGYFSAAHYLYSRWGAHRKVIDLESKYPQLLQLRASRRSEQSITAKSTVTATGMLDSNSLDISSVMKASQAISGEIVAEQLMKTTLQLVLENTGGQKGYLVADEDGVLVIKAQTEVDSEQDSDVTSVAVLGTGKAPLLPTSIVNFVLRTGVPLVLNDATESSRFANDPYIVRSQPKSVLCIALRRHGNFRGAIYIENNLATGAFTEERVEIIKLLAAQASISMENAGLFAEQVRLTEAQQRFVPSQFLEILGHKDIAQVGLGEYVAKEMSVLFSDLRDFTALAEQLGPNAVIELLNRYFSRLSQPVTEAGGYIDSYNGDGITALIGQSADIAVETGINMCRALEEFNTESRALGSPKLKMGLGVNTGTLLLGTVGAHDRLQCSLVGDSVNLASRIEQLTKYYGTPFLIGQHTYERLRTPEKFSIRLVDRVAVKGKQQAIDLYEVLDAESRERRKSKESTRAQLNRAMEHYFARDFNTASEFLTKAISKDPADSVLSILSDRSKQYAKLPPPPEWGGFEVLSHK